ncbi:hypothetical protein ABH944_003277 [Caballeronia udeis]|uniref:Uncharacterized protein n=1 Tax=Caballeronia udeis TaxID=1232866 RepID=A0ABW8MGZ7_9BURK
MAFNRCTSITRLPTIDGRAQNLNADRILTVTQYEVTADTGTIDPQASILYELNCRDRMMRELSIPIHAGNKNGFSDKPGEWKYVPPEGNSARLLKMLCAALQLFTSANKRVLARSR